MSQAIPLVPSIRKDIEADLAACQVGRETQKLKVERRLMTCPWKNVPFTCVSTWTARLIYTALRLGSSSFHLVCFSNMISSKI